jgi:hypothetical protein
MQDSPPGNRDACPDGVTMKDYGVTMKDYGVTMKDFTVAVAVALRQLFAEGKRPLLASPWWQTLAPPRTSMISSPPRGCGTGHGPLVPNRGPPA